jgi:HEAT repeat protein
MGVKGGNALLAALVHPNWDVRADAAAALGEIGMTTAVNMLEQLSRDDKEELVRRAARDAIARLRKETR